MAFNAIWADGSTINILSLFFFSSGWTDLQLIFYFKCNFPLVNYSSTGLTQHLFPNCVNAGSLCNMFASRFSIRRTQQHSTSLLYSSCFRVGFHLSAGQLFCFFLNWNTLLPPFIWIKILCRNFLFALTLRNTSHNKRHCQNWGLTVVISASVY